MKTLVGNVLVDSNEVKGDILQVLDEIHLSKNI